MSPEPCALRSLGRVWPDRCTEITRGSSRPTSKIIPDTFLPEMAHTGEQLFELYNYLFNVRYLDRQN